MPEAGGKGVTKSESNMNTKQCASMDMTCQQEKLMKSKYNERIIAANIFVKLPTQEIEIYFHIRRTS